MVAALQSSSPVPIYRSKLERPRISGPYIQRSTLEARLDRALAVPLTVIAAPAGHGKTRTLEEWLSARGYEATWLSLGAQDRNLTRFAAYVAAALDNAIPGLGYDLDARLVAPDRLAPRELGEAFGESLFDLTHDLILILDDFHLADGPPVAAFLEGLIAAAPARLHVIVSSRRKPTLPLARLRVLGWVVELTGADFRFSVGETSALLELASGAVVDPEVAARAHSAVGGWPAAVRLLAAGVGASGIVWPVADEFDVDHEQPVVEFLGEEVLSQLTALQRDLLLRASLPERFNGALLQALAQDMGHLPPSAIELDDLRSLDLYRLIPGLEETWFTYHALFRAVFQQQLLQDIGEAGVAALHHACARWFAEQALTHEAVWHLVQAGDIGAAAALIESRVVEAFGREDWQAVASWLALIPESEVERRAVLLLASAWTAYLSGRGGRLVAHVTSLRDQREQRLLTDRQSAEVDLLGVETPDFTGPGHPQSAQFLADVVPRLDPSHRYRYGFAQMMLGLALAREGRVGEALERLDAFTRAESARIDAAAIRGVFGRVLVLWQDGQLAACQQAAADQWQLALVNNLPVSAGWGELFLGLAAHEWGDVDRASRHFAAVIADAEHLHFQCVREAFCRQVLVFESQGQRDEADRTLGRFREFVMSIEAPEHLAICDSLAARLAMFRGDRVAVERWLASAPAQDEPVQLLHLENPGMTRAMALISLGTSESIAEAAALLATLRQRAEAGHFKLARMDVLALMALLRQAEGDTRGAVSRLRDALVLGSNERIGHRLSFLPLPLLPLLRAIVSQPAAPPGTSDLLRFLASNPAADAEPSRTAVSTRDVLTSRELEVARCLARRLTNNEIGDELYVSPITVKHHIANISSKLGVSGRRAAVARAAELGLLD